MAEEGSKFSYFAFGLGLGLAIGVLFAPKSGEETREFIRTKADEGKEYLKRRSDELRDQAGDVVERGKEAVTRQRDNLAAAVEAGKQAYRDAVSGRPPETESSPGQTLDQLSNMPENLLYIMTAAIVVAAVAIIIQTILLFAMYLASRAMKNQVTLLVNKVEPMTESGQHLLEETRGHVGEITSKLNELMELTRKQLARVDEVLGEATSRTRAQMDRIEMVLDDTVNRFQETTTLLQNGILRPLRQLNALTAGLRAALSVLVGGNRTTVEHATHDEEMFI